MNIRSKGGNILTKGVGVIFKVKQIEHRFTYFEQKIKLGNVHSCKPCHSNCLSWPAWQVGRHQTSECFQLEAFRSCTCTKFCIYASTWACLLRALACLVFPLCGCMLLCQIKCFWLHPPWTCTLCCETLPFLLKGSVNVSKKHVEENVWIKRRQERLCLWPFLYPECL